MFKSTCTIDFNVKHVIYILLKSNIKHGKHLHVELFTESYNLYYNSWSVFQFYLLQLIFQTENAINFRYKFVA